MRVFWCFRMRFGVNEEFGDRPMYYARYRTSERHTESTQYTTVAVFMELPARGRTRVWPAVSPVASRGSRRPSRLELGGQYVDTHRALVFQRLLESLGGLESVPLCSKKSYSDRHVISDEEAMANTYRMSWRAQCGAGEDDQEDDDD